MNRRTLLLRSLLASSSLLVSKPILGAVGSDPWTQEKPKFKMDLCGKRVGIEASQEQLIQLAQQYGFSAVEPLVRELTSLGPDKLDELKAKLVEAKLVWSAASLPVDFRNGDEKFKQDLKKLPASAQVLQSAGVTRIGTGIMPFHDSSTYRANFRKHATRLKQTTQILEQHGLRLGLEYIGTKTLWTRMRYPFIHTMKETLELISVIGQNNVGLILDSWHWTMAGETPDEIRALENQKVVAVDLNDAPAGIELDKQIDSTRELPLATGVIDVKSFLQALVDIKYDGPIRAEPFNNTLNEMENEPAAAATSEAMKKAFATVGA